MSQEGFPKPDKDSEIPKETEEVIDNLLADLPKGSREFKKLPEAFVRFAPGSIEDLVCILIIQGYKDVILLKAKEVESWEQDTYAGTEYQLPEYEHERELFNKILADDTIYFLKHDIRNETTRELGFALERQGKLKKGRTRIIHNLIIDSKGEINKEIQTEFEEVIEDTIDRIVNQR